MLARRELKGLSKKSGPQGIREGSRGLLARSQDRLSAHQSHATTRYVTSSPLSIPFWLRTISTAFPLTNDNIYSKF